MKKITAFLVALLMLLSVTSCERIKKLPSRADGELSYASEDEAASSAKGTEDDPYIITTADELFKFAEDYNAYKLSEDIHVRLDADINVNNISEVYTELNADSLEGYRMWIPVKYFRGTFDGNGHTVSGIVCCMETNEEGTIVWPSALFGFMMEGSVVKNLTVKESFFTSNTKNYTAGICGSLRNGTIENCNNYAKILGYTASGGIVASNTGGIIKDCNNYANISNINTNSTKGLGGICGTNYTDWETNTTAKIINCANYGNLVGVDVTGGIAGYSRGFIIDCVNKGEIVSDNYAGGIAGTSLSNGNELGHIENCVNFGVVQGVRYAGGITGAVGSENLACGAESCINYGDVSAIECGGIAAFARDSYIKNCCNTGKVASTDDGSRDYAAGICVDIRESCKVENCYNTGEVSSTEMAGGLCYSLRGEISNCYNAGTVTASKKGYGLTCEIYDGTMYNCYNLAGVNAPEYDMISGYQYGGTVDSCVSAVNDSRALSASFYYGFDFDNVWTIDSSAEYPYPTLKNIPTDVTE